jgi:hypothetical protein
MNIHKVPSADQAVRSSIAVTLLEKLSVLSVPPWKGYLLPPDGMSSASHFAPPWRGELLLSDGTTPASLGSGPGEGTTHCAVEIRRPHSLLI